MAKSLNAEVVFDPKDRGLTAWAVIGEEKILIGQQWFRERGEYDGNIRIGEPYLRERIMAEKRKYILSKKG